MSLSEILIIIIVALLVMKPEDLPKIIKKFKKLKSFITNTKQEIFSHLDHNFNQDLLAAKNSNDLLDHEINQVNYYLEKIANLDSEYVGEYSLPQIKNHYRQLMDKKIKNDLHTLNKTKKNF